MFGDWSLKGVVEGLVGGLAKPLLNTYLTAQKQKLDALGTHEARLESLAITAQRMDMREAELNNALLQVEAARGTWWQRMPRPAMASAVVVLVWKILVWDLALGQWTKGNTDKLSDQAFWIVTTIIIAYFGGRTIEKGVNVVANIFKGRK